jgi:L-serine dehydratase
MEFLTLSVLSWSALPVPILQVLPVSAAWLIKFLGERVVKADIGFSGSFAKTYHGHGTDKAIIAGLLGFMPDDERIRDALDIAARQGLDFDFSTIQLEGAHPNTACMDLIGINGHTAHIIGSSIGGGNIRITDIDGYDVNITGRYPVLIIVQRDRPGLITQVTSILARYEMNIAFMHVSREAFGETAMMIMELDDMPADEVIDECREVCDVQHAFSIPAI